MSILCRDISVSLDKETFNRIAVIECKVHNNIFKSKTNDVCGLYFKKGNIKFGRFLMKSLGYSSNDYIVHKGPILSYFQINNDDLTFDNSDLTFIRIEQELIFK